MKDIKSVEQAVLKVYKKVNPSEIPIEDEAVFQRWKTQRERLFVDRLKILPAAFRQTRLLEVGGGTGEKTVLYSQWGADITLIDSNPAALERAAFLWKRFGCSAARGIEQSLFDLRKTDLAPHSFDFVFCEGVIHHTADPIGALQILSDYVKPGGLLLLAFAEASGIKARLLQRAFIRAAAGDDEDKIVAVAKQYFQEHLDRCVTFGGRSERSVIYDSYVNPQLVGIDPLDLLDVLHANGFRYYSGTPELNFPYATGPYNQSTIDYFDPRANRKWIGHLQENWLVSGRDSDDQKFTDARCENIHEKDKFLQLEQQIATGDRDIPAEDLSVIQKGFLGIGLHYLVSVKTTQT